MSLSIRVYIEGGGQTRKGKKAIEGDAGKRIGFESFFRKKIITRNVYAIACEGRDSTHVRFAKDVNTQRDAICVLLVDSEGFVEEGHSPARHLANRDGWQIEPKLHSQIHLMVQAVEAWLICDIDALKEFYRAKVLSKSLVGIEVENQEPHKLFDLLQHATKGLKGEPDGYHKIRHASKLLGQIDPEKVIKRAPHCKKLFEYLLAQSK